MPHRIGHGIEFRRLKPDKRLIYRYEKASHQQQGLGSGMYWTRTSDPHVVDVML